MMTYVYVSVHKMDEHTYLLLKQQDLKSRIRHYRTRNCLLYDSRVDKQVSADIRYSCRCLHPRVGSCFRNSLPELFEIPFTSK